MADRPTSIAKSVEGLHHEESALDRARALRDQFNRAQNDNQQQKDRQTERQTERPPAEGSQMIRQDTPVLRPTPTGPMRAGPDRYAAATKLGKEHDKEDAKIEEAKKLQEAFKALQSKSHDRERDHER